MTYAEQFAQIIPLVEKLYEKYPAYIHLDFCLSTDRDGNLPGVKKVKYNIYTPEISHNNYHDFDKFIAFIKLLIEDGVKDVRVKVLEERIENSKKNKNNAEKNIAAYLKELEEIKKKD